MSVTTCLNCLALIPEDRQRRHAKYCTPGCGREASRTAYRKANPNNGLTSGSIGAISELLVCADLLKHGYEVFRAVSPSCSCDVAILKNNRLLRVEVRTVQAYVTAAGKTNYICSSHGGKADILAKVTHHGQITYEPELDS